MDDALWALQMTILGTAIMFVVLFVAFQQFGMV